MPIYNFEELCWPDFNNFNREKTIILVPIAPLEEHGPHLPFGVDYYDSDFFCRNAAHSFSQKHSEYNVIIYPAIPLGSDCFRFPGTVDISQKAIYLTAKSIGKAFGAYGFNNVMFVGLHGGPRHITALEQACRSLNRRYKMNALAPFGSVLTKMFMDRDFAETARGRELSDEEWYKFERDLHGGFVETSLMLHHHEELVKDNYKTAKDYPVKLLEMRRHPFGRFSEWDGQLGYPSLASKEIGKELIDNLTKYFVELIEKWINKENVKKFNKSLLSKMMIFNINFKLWLISIIAAVIGIVLFFILT